VTLLVTNGTCQGGHCDSLRVLDFPSNQPLTPGGYWSLDLGLITASEACFTLPPTAAFHVIGVRPDGTGHDHVYMDERYVSIVGSGATFFFHVASETYFGWVRASKRGWVADHRSRRITSDSEFSLHALIGKKVVEAVRAVGRYLAVWRRESDGRWRCVEDYTTPGPAEAAPRT